MVKKIIQFLTRDIWRVRGRDLAGKRSYVIKPLRVVVLSLRGFQEDKCRLWASALTFFSLLSIVPVFALLFGIAKGFGLDKMLERQLLTKFSGQEEVVTRIITFSRTLLENTRGGVVAGIGVVFLFWTVIRVLGNIERSFNDIWGVKKPRSIGRKFSDYLSVMMVCPVLFIVSSSVTVFIQSQVTLLVEKTALLGAFSPVIFFLLRLLPFVVLWILFSFIYVFMPNTKVHIRSGIVAGIAAGTVYQVVQWAYIGLQIGASRMNAIYGSFAALPLFLIWMQLSWLIVLFGAEISFAHQNVDTYEYEPDCTNISLDYRRLLTLYIFHLMVSRFDRGEAPLPAEDISHRLDIPIRLVRDILFELQQDGLANEVQLSGYQDTAYQPARDAHSLTVASVLRTLESHGSTSIPVPETSSLKKLKSVLADFNRRIAGAESNILLKDLPSHHGS
ncbi:MAG: YihY family inner membrane protein [Candidatus Omnitrophica bacterium]|nr:YihY family inner membrane protein [Candidatus Omnitrophota bacterium]